jgi:2-amino-4-hydroxy-6-hydroxymethyldihydropteridine diphosphokinase
VSFAKPFKGAFVDCDCLHQFRIIAALMRNMQRDLADLRIFLSLGTNLGDRRANLREAIEHIQDLGLVVVAESSIYETEPVGFADQDWFLNQVIEVKISESRMLKISKDEAKFIEMFLEQNDRLGAQVFLAGSLLRALLKIETEMGRQRTFKNGPRVIDIDMLLVNDFCIQSLGENQESLQLIIPHPRMRERRFVLEPLCEIAPDLIDPVSKKPFIDLLAALDERPIVTRLSTAP